MQVGLIVGRSGINAIVTVTVCVFWWQTKTENEDCFVVLSRGKEMAEETGPEAETAAGQ